jgi:hypothetical protein
LLVASGTLFACGPPPGTTPVSVDLDRLLAREPARPPTVSLPTPPAPEPAQELNLPAIPPKRVEFSQTDVARLEQRLRERQEQARRELARRLRDFYRREARRFELDQLRALAERDEMRRQELNATLRTVFEQYADRRAPLLANLANLAGFPDPNPAGSPPPDSTGNVTRQRLERAQGFREEIRQLDAEFTATVLRLTLAGNDLSAEDQLQTRLAIERFIADLDRRAQEEAQRQVARAIAQIEFDLADLKGVTLPAVPGRRLRVEGDRAFSPIAPPRPDPLLDANVERRKRLESQLKIWLALNRYRLQAGSRDVTEDFDRWRKQNQVGL